MIEALNEWVRKKLQDENLSAFLISLGTISGTEGDVYREQLLLMLWKQIPTTYWKKKWWRNALGNVASTTCSIELAKHLIEQGIPVDSKVGDQAPTALTHASRKSSAAAAELMRYLLFCGADAEVQLWERQGQ
jgi:hypothetical protein